MAIKKFGLKNRVYLTVAMSMIGFAALIAGFFLGEVYGDKTYVETAVYQKGFIAGNNRAILTMQRRGVPEAVSMKMLTYQNRDPILILGFLNTDPAGLLETEDRISENFRSEAYATPEEIESHKQIRAKALQRLKDQIRREVEKEMSLQKLQLSPKMKSSNYLEI